MELKNKLNQYTHLTAHQYSTLALSKVKGDSIDQDAWQDILNSLSPYLLLFVLWHLISLQGVR